MKNNKKILLTFLHGDEDLGSDLWDFIGEKHEDLLKNLTFIAGNPRARRFHERLVDTDLNRSFVEENFAKSYEKKRSVELSRKFREGKYDLILDLHTTTVAGEPIFVSAVDRTPEVEKFRENSFISKTVVMPPEIADVSLIGRFANSISVEINRDDAKTDKILEKIVRDIRNALANYPESFAKSDEIYDVFSYFGNDEFSENEILAAENFAEFHGFSPVLLGEKSYRKMGKYIGFKAKKR